MFSSDGILHRGFGCLYFYKLQTTLTAACTSGWKYCPLGDNDVQVQVFVAHGASLFVTNMAGHAQTWLGSLCCATLLSTYLLSTSLGTEEGGRYMEQE